MKTTSYLLVLALVSSFCFSVQAQSQKLVFSPHWLPQAQFAGYYVAEEMGFYKEAGIDVEIIHPSASVNAMQFLQSGRADIISLFMVSGLDNRFQGVDLVNIAQFSHNSALMFVAKKTSNINTLEDFNGKKIGIWRSGFEEIPKALIREHQLDVSWVPILSTVNLFLLGGIDIMTVMWYNEYNQIYLSGLNADELSTFFLSDYGYNTPEDGLYVLQNTRNEKEDALKAFVEASIKGWQYVEANRDYALDIVIDRMRKANVPSNMAHQEWMLDKVLELQKPIGQTMLEKADFDQVHSILKGEHQEAQDVLFEDFFRPVR
jgi:NitT/TauT family transport system substrate-binding protein